MFQWGSGSPVVRFRSDRMWPTLLIDGQFQRDKKRNGNSKPLTKDGAQVPGEAVAGFEGMVQYPQSEFHPSQFRQGGDLDVSP